MFDEVRPTRAPQPLWSGLPTGRAKLESLSLGEREAIAIGLAVMAQRFLNRLRDACRACSDGWGPHLEGLLRPPVIVDLDPDPDGPEHMLLRPEALPVHALLFQTTDQALHHPVLLRGVRGDELLL